MVSYMSIKRDSKKTGAFRFLVLFLTLTLLPLPALSLEILIDYPIHEILESDLSPRGTLLATAHPGNFVEIRSLRPAYLDGRLFPLNRERIEGLEFLSEKDLLVVTERGIELWERKGIGKWELRGSLRRAEGSPFTWGRRLIAYMPSEEEIGLYDIERKENTSSIRNLPGFVKRLSLSRDESALFVLLSDGALLSYRTDDGGLLSEIGKLKDPLEVFNGKAVTLDRRWVKVINLGDLSTLHEIKAEEKVERVLMKDEDLLILSTKGTGFLFRLKEGSYSLERRFDRLLRDGIKLTGKGVLSWSKEEISLNDERLKTLSPRSLVPKEVALEGEKLAEIGENFAVVWDLKTFAPEFLFKGEVYLIEGKLYLRREGKYLCYDLRKGESREIETEGKIVRGSEPFIWEPPYLRWEGGRVKLREEPKWAYLLSEGKLLWTDEGLYDVKSGERILNLKGKRALLSKALSSLVILEGNEVRLYGLESRLARSFKLSYKRAYLSDDGERLALIAPDEYGVILLNLRSGREREIEDEKLGRIREATFIDGNLLITGENGLSLFSETGDRLLFEEMRGIEGIQVIEGERVLISKGDGTVWLYSIKRKRPMIYHDLNGLIKEAKVVNGRILVLLDTGEIYVLSLRNVRPWLCFLFFSQDDWMVLSSGNYFNSSPKTKERILWLEGKNIYTGEKGFERYMSLRGLRGIWNEL